MTRKEQIRSVYKLTGCQCRLEHLIYPLFPKYTAYILRPETIVYGFRAAVFID